MAVEIEGVIQDFKVLGPYAGANSSAYYIHLYTVSNQTYIRTSASKSSTILPGDLVWVTYNEVIHKAELQKRIETIELIQPKFPRVAVPAHSIDENHKLRALEIASQMFLASADSKDLPLSSINAMTLIQADRIISYITSDI